MVGGDHIQGLMTVVYERPSSDEKNFSQRFTNKAQLSAILYVMYQTNSHIFSFYILHFSSGTHKVIRLDKSLPYDSVLLLAATQWGEQNADVFRRFLDRDIQLKEELAQETKGSGHQIKSIMDEMDPRILSALEVFLVDKVLEKYA